MQFLKAKKRAYGREKILSKTQSPYANSKQATETQWEK
jgi:hypothetical protein